MSNKITMFYIIDFIRYNGPISGLDLLNTLEEYGFTDRMKNARLTRQALDCGYIGLGAGMKLIYL